MRTGASGFLGWQVCEDAPKGWKVMGTWHSNPDGLSQKVQATHLDLTNKDAVWKLLKSTNPDAVLHLAASKAGDMYTQYAGTVVATENLLEAMTAAGVRRIVGISSFAVYDYLNRWSHSTLDFSNLKRDNRTTGWKFGALIVVISTQVVFKQWSGRPRIEETELRRHPLGPLQGIGESLQPLP